MNRAFAFAAVLSFLAGCGPATTEEEPSADAEACGHLNDGPSIAVTATAASTGAPAVSTAHTRFDVTLVDVTGGKGGSVSYASAHELDHTIFLNDDVPVKVTDSSGGAVALSSSATSSAECSAVKGRHVVPLKVGTYTLTFGPTTKTSARMVIEASEHTHAHEH